MIDFSLNVGLLSMDSYGKSPLRAELGDSKLPNP